MNLLMIISPTVSFLLILFFLYFLFSLHPFPLKDFTPVYTKGHVHGRAVDGLGQEPGQELPVPPQRRSSLSILYLSVFLSIDLPYI